MLYLVNMKYLFLLIIIFNLNSSHAQNHKWELSGGLGLSGVNQIIKNNVDFDNYIFFNKKNNLLDNKFRNNILHTGYISISRALSHNKLKGFRANLSFAMYSFSSVYYKEEKFSISFGQNDTINTPNWLREKYSLPFIEL